MHQTGSDKTAGNSEDLVRIFDNIPDAVVVVDSEGLISRVNRICETMLGYDAAELVGLPVEVLVPPRFREQHATDAAKYLATPERRPMGTGLQLFAVRKDGSEIPVDISLSPYEDDSPHRAVAVIRDMTERRRVEDALRHTEQELEDQRRHHAVVADRERIAMDLHDGVIQDLYSIGMALQGVEFETGDQEMKARLGQLVDAIDHVIGDIRHYIHRLRPGVLAYTDLRSSLTLLAEELHQLTGITARTDIDPEVATRLVPKAQIILHSVREAVSNVARHSGASECVLRVTSDGDWMIVEVVDDGHGFEPDKGASSGFGLNNLRKRLEPAGGLTEIESRPGFGTTVRFKFRSLA